MDFNRHDIRRIAKITGISAASIVAAIAQAQGAPPRELIYPEPPSLILPESALSREERGMMQKLGIIPGLGFVPAFGGGAAGLNVADVFKITTYAGNSSSRTITTGLDLSANGGSLWIKELSLGYQWALHDTVRGVNKMLNFNSNAQDTDDTDTVTSYGTTGFGLGANTGSGGGNTAARVNTSGSNYVAYSFREFPEFYDVRTVSHTNGVATTIGLSVLGTIGMAFAKQYVVSGGNWHAWHRSLTAGNTVVLGGTQLQGAGTELSVSGTTLTLSASLPTGTYLVGAFAHNGAGGAIQCGSYTGNGFATGPIVTLGRVPQWVLIKRITGSSSGSPGWYIVDSARAALSGANDQFLDLSSSVTPTAVEVLEPTSDGFQLKTTNTGMNASGAEHIYVAIAEP